MSQPLAWPEKSCTIISQYLKMNALKSSVLNSPIVRCDSPDVGVEEVELIIHREPLGYLLKVYCL